MGFNSGFKGLITLKAVLGGDSGGGGREYGDDNYDYDDDNCNLLVMCRCQT